MPAAALVPAVSTLLERPALGPGEAWEHNLGSWTPPLTGWKVVAGPPGTIGTNPWQSVIDASERIVIGPHAHAVQVVERIDAEAAGIREMRQGGHDTQPPFYRMGGLGGRNGKGDPA